MSLRSCAGFQRHCLIIYSPSRIRKTQCCGRSQGACGTICSGGKNGVLATTACNGGRPDRGSVLHWPTTNHCGVQRNPSQLYPSPLRDQIGPLRPNLQWFTWLQQQQQLDRERYQQPAVTLKPTKLKNLAHYILQKLQASFQSHTASTL